MNLWIILSSRERVDTLSHILEKETVGVEETAKSLGRSKGFVSQFFSLLEEEEILKKSGRRYEVLHSLPIVKAIKTLLNVIKLYSVLIKHRRGWMESIGIYGSFARGENKEDSDVDVWIRVREHPGELEVASVEKSISIELGKQVHLLILTPEKIERLRKEDPVFYCELVNSIVIWGGGIGF